MGFEWSGILYPNAFLLMEVGGFKWVGEGVALLEMGGFYQPQLTRFSQS